MKRYWYASILIGALLAAPDAYASGKDSYEKYCSVCHHSERYGLTGPPLMPEYLGRRKAAEIQELIASGLPATNMPAFKEILTKAEIGELASFIMTPIEKPVWGDSEILASVSTVKPDENRKSPYDLTNLFMIVEGGAGKVHFMDGDSFKLLGNIKVGPIHGGPKFDKDLRFAYLAARDGWVIKYDVVNFKEAGRIRAGISSRNIAISADSRYLAVANLLPENLVIVDASTMKPVKTFSAEGAYGSVYSLRSKGEFVVALRDKPEIIVINDKSLEARPIKTDQPFTDFFIGPEERFLIGTSRDGKQITVVDVEKGAVAAKIKTEAGMPHLASAAIWKEGERAYAAFPNIGKPVITVLELYTWEIKKELTTKGAGFFARTHDNIPNIWADTGTDTIQLIDKKTLEFSGEVVPEKDKKAMHIEFTKDGGYAFVSVWENDGAVNIYDSKTLKQVKSMPFKKPVGKYNATNKKF